MKVVLSWLRESCPVDLSPEELGELLDSKGMHVESIDRPWEGLDGVVVARDEGRGEMRLVGYVVPGDGEELTPAALLTSIDDIFSLPRPRDMR